MSLMERIANRRQEKENTRNLGADRNVQHVLEQAGQTWGGGKAGPATAAFSGGVDVRRTELALPTLGATIQMDVYAHPDDGKRATMFRVFADGDEPTATSFLGEVETRAGMDNCLGCVREQVAAFAADLLERDRSAGAPGMR